MGDRQIDKQVGSLEAGERQTGGQEAGKRQMGRKAGRQMESRMWADRLGTRAGDNTARRPSEPPLDLPELVEFSEMQVDPILGL